MKTSKKSTRENCRHGLALDWLGLELAWAGLGTPSRSRHQLWPATLTLFCRMHVCYDVAKFVCNLLCDRVMKAVLWFCNRVAKPLQSTQQIVEHILPTLKQIVCKIVATAVQMLSKYSYVVNASARN